MANTIQVSLYTNFGDVDAFAAEWDALCADIPQAALFTSWDWIRTWWQSFGQGRELYILAARDERGSLRGLAPWMRETRRFGIGRLRVLAFIGTGLVYPVHLDLLIRDQDRELVLAAFKTYLAQHTRDWDVLDLAAVAQGSALDGLNPRRAVRVSPVTSPYISLPNNWDNYLATRSKKLRRNLRYFRTKLEDDYPGQVSFRCVTDPLECRNVINRLGELNSSRRHAQGLASAFDEAAFQTFLADIAQVSLSRDTLRLFYLSVGDTVIAVFYCFRYHNRLFAYQMGFDVAWYGYSPGRLLIAHGIKSAIQEQASELDWLAGNDDYKLAWTEQTRQESELLIGNTWRGIGWIRVQTAKATIIARAKRWLSQPVLAKLQRLQSGWRKPKGAATGNEPTPTAYNPNE